VVPVGPVHKKDIMKAAIMLEYRVEYATVLAFDVKITPDAEQYASVRASNLTIVSVLS